MFCGTPLSFYGSNSSQSFLQHTLLNQFFHMDCESRRDFGSNGLFSKSQHCVKWFKFVKLCWHTIYNYQYQYSVTCYWNPNMYIRVLMAMKEGFPFESHQCLFLISSSLHYFLSRSEAGAGWVFRLLCLNPTL